MFLENLNHFIIIYFFASFIDFFSDFIKISDVVAKIKIVVNENSFNVHKIGPIAIIIKLQLELWRNFSSSKSGKGFFFGAHFSHDSQEPKVNNVKTLLSQG